MASRWYRKEGILPVALGLAALGVASYFLLFAPELRTIGSLRAEVAAKAEAKEQAKTLRRAQKAGVDLSEAVGAGSSRRTHRAPA